MHGQRKDTEHRAHTETEKTGRTILRHTLWEPVGETCRWPSAFLFDWLSKLVRAARRISCRRDSCHFEDIPFVSKLNHVIKMEGAAAE